MKACSSAVPWPVLRVSAMQALYYIISKWELIPIRSDVTYTYLQTGIELNTWLIGLYTWYRFLIHVVNRGRFWLRYLTLFSSTGSGCVDAEKASALIPQTNIADNTAIYGISETCMSSFFPSTPFCYATRYGRRLCMCDVLTSLKKVNIYQISTPYTEGTNCIQSFSRDEGCIFLLYIL